MTTLKVKHNDLNKMLKWCDEHVGPRKFYMHNHIGGENWSVKQDNSGWNLNLKDSRIALIALLKFSEELTK